MPRGACTRESTIPLTTTREHPARGERRGVTARFHPLTETTKTNLSRRIGRSLAVCVALASGAWSAQAAGPSHSSVAWRLTANVPYGDPAQHLALDLYLPEYGSSLTPVPVIVYFHGGGWVKGDKADPRDKSIASDLASEGYAVASVNYRLGRAVWPRNLGDCRDALLYVRQHASAYRFDTTRIAVMGASAGAHLALMVGLTETEDRLAHSFPWPPLRAIVDFYGITDLVSRTKPHADGTPTLVPDDLHANEMLGSTRNASPALWASASPVNHLAKGEPPIFIAHGLIDPTVDHRQAEELAARLVERHLPYEMVLLPGAGHMFDLRTWKGAPLSVDLLDHTLDFLDRTVRSAP